MLFMKRNGFTIMLASAILVACSGGGGGGGDSTTAPTDGGPTGNTGPRDISGVLLMPGKYSGSCVDVPSGFSPLANASVDVRNGSGEAIQTITTTQCGAISRVQVSADARWLTVTEHATQMLITSVSTLVEDQSHPVASRVASSFDRSQGVEIATLHEERNAGDAARSVFIAIVDKASLEPVIGFPAEAVSVLLGSQEEPISNFRNVGFSDENPMNISLNLQYDGILCGGHIWHDVTLSDDCSAITAATLQERFSAITAAGHRIVDNRRFVDTISVNPGGGAAGLSIALSAASTSNGFYNRGSGEHLYGADWIASDPDAGKLHLRVDVFNPFSDIYAEESSDLHRQALRLAPRHEDDASIEFRGSYDSIYPIAFTTGDANRHNISEISAGQFAIYPGKISRSATIHLLSGDEPGYPAQTAAEASELGAAGPVAVVLDIGGSVSEDANLRSLALDFGGFYRHIIPDASVAAVVAETIARTLAYEYKIAIPQDPTSTSHTQTALTVSLHDWNGNIISERMIRSFD